MLYAIYTISIICKGLILECLKYDKHHLFICDFFSGMMLILKLCCTLILVAKLRCREVSRACLLKLELSCHTWLCVKYGRLGAFALNFSRLPLDINVY